MFFVTLAQQLRQETDKFQRINLFHLKLVLHPQLWFYIKLPKPGWEKLDPLQKSHNTSNEGFKHSVLLFMGPRGN